MYIKFDEEILDYDLQHLRDHLAFLDERLANLERCIDQCSDPDGMGLFDELEYLAGMGFVACQRYLASTYGQYGTSKDDALKLEPAHRGGEPVARILNAAANYWKHVDEWNSDATVARNPEKLNDQQRRTIRIIETAAPWCDYTCANLLWELTAELRFIPLIAQLEDWRGKLDLTYSP